MNDIIENSFDKICGKHIDVFISVRQTILITVANILITIINVLAKSGHLLSRTEDIEVRHKWKSERSLGLFLCEFNTNAKDIRFDNLGTGVRQWDGCRVYYAIVQYYFDIQSTTILSQ